MRWRRVVYGRRRRNLSRRRGKGSADPGIGFAIIFVIVVVIPITLLNAALIGLGLPEESNVTLGIAVFIYLIVVIVVGWGWVIAKRKAEEERSRQMEEERRKREEQQEEQRKRQEIADRMQRQIEEEQHKRRERQEEERRKREEQERAEQIEAMLERDAFRESVHYMSGVEFENFMANVFDKKGYQVQTTPHQDQGVDLLLTIDDRKVAVQLKRYTAPVGNKAVADVVAGMFHYKAKEAWVITTSSFTKSAVELAKSTRVRLIDGRELEDWLDDLRDEA
jgi:restriction endonuclease Mrr